MKKLLIGLLTLMTFSSFASVSDVNLDIESMSSYCESNDSVCKGDKVLHENSIRVVELVDRTGRVVLEEESYYYQTFTTVDKISKIVPRFGRYKAGDKVLNEDTIRVVEHVDNTGRVILEDESKYYRTFTTADKISKIIPRFNGYQAGDKVLIGDSIRIVEFVDNTGRVVLGEDSRNYRIYTTNSEITMVEACQ